MNISEKFFDKSGLISIGKLSKITGVHIQSLRYYEKIGILIPAFVDTDSKYRYYSFSQIKIVEAIQYCVELDIPLKNFSAFISNDQNQIDYEKLLNYGKEIAQYKIRAIKEKMSFFEELHDDMYHGEICLADDFMISRLPQKTYLTIPYCGTQTCGAFHSAIIKLLEQIRCAGMQTSYDSGLLSLYKKSGVEHFAYVDILDIGNQSMQNLNIIEIPETDFICRKKTESNIQNAPKIFPDRFAKSYDKIVVERELFTGKFAYTSPLYEIRCSLK